MSIRTAAIFLFITLTAFACHFKSKAPTSTDALVPVSFNDTWSFSVAGQPTTFVNIPHTPRIEPLIVNDQWQGEHIYEKTFDISTIDPKQTYLHFEGVMHHSHVYLNGHLIKSHMGGYLPFAVDLTDHLVPGKNTLRIEVSNADNSQIPPGKPLEGLDFNFYGGIYRDVWMIRKNSTYITDPFIEQTKEAGWVIHFDEVSPDNAKGTLDIQVKNDGDDEADIRLNIVLANGDYSQTFEQIFTAKPSGLHDLSIALAVPDPALWSPHTPSLYDLTINVFQDGRLMDQVKEKVGIRKIELKDEGFFLNGEKQFIRGTNRHQEYPYVGYALSNNANFRDALKIKNAGFDFVRLSHYPQDKAFLKACDELGLMVMNAIPGWQYYEEGTFVENAYQDIRDMVRRDRNHPSVVFWEVSLNESGMTDSFMVEANRILKEELPYDDTYSAGWIDHSSYDIFIPARQHAKPPHYWNLYKEGKRHLFIAEYGDWEYYAHNAGFNQTAFEDLTEEERTSRQLRAHGEKRLLQQAFNYQEATNSNRKGLAGTIGHANWLMFDYNRGYADDLEASGISDIFRIPKFAYYFYSSQRPPHEASEHPLIEDGPMVKIASHWTSDSSPNVRIFSNCEEVALFLNDQLIARKTPTITPFSSHLNHPPFDFELGQFTNGQIVAKGYIGGEIVATDTVRTPGKATQILLKADTSGLIKESDDLIFLYAHVTDRKQTTVVDNTSPVLFELLGPGQLIGENPVNAEAGIATILYRGDPTSLNVKATIPTLKEANYP